MLTIINISTYAYERYMPCMGDNPNVKNLHNECAKINKVVVLKLHQNLFYKLFFITTRYH